MEDLGSPPTPPPPQQVLFPIDDNLRDLFEQYKCKVTFTTDTAIDIEHKVFNGHYGYDCAVKFVDLKIGEHISEGALHRITNEIKILEKIEYPNLVTVFEIIIQQYEQNHTTRAWIVMQREMTNLKDYVDIKGTFDIQNTQRIGWQTLNAVNYLHNGMKGWHVFHRNIKPSNVLLTSDLQVKLTDFLLAKMFKKFVYDSEESKKQRAKGFVANDYTGSMWYMPPEVMLAHDDHFTEGYEYHLEGVDMFGIGLIIYYAYNGQVFERSGNKDEAFAIYFELVKKGNWRDLPHHTMQEPGGLALFHAIDGLLDPRTHNRLTMDQAFSLDFFQNCPPISGYAPGYEKKAVQSFLRSSPPPKGSKPDARKKFTERVEASQPVVEHWNLVPFDTHRVASRPSALQRLRAGAKNLGYKALLTTAKKTTRKKHLQEDQSVTVGLLKLSADEQADAFSTLNDSLELYRQPGSPLEMDPPSENDDDDQHPSPGGGGQGGGALPPGSPPAPPGSPPAPPGSPPAPPGSPPAPANQEGSFHGGHQLVDYPPSSNSSNASSDGNASDGEDRGAGAVAIDQARRTSRNSQAVNSPLALQPNLSPVASPVAVQPPLALPPTRSPAAAPVGVQTPAAPVHGENQNRSKTTSQERAKRRALHESEKQKRAELNEKLRQLREKSLQSKGTRSSTEKAVEKEKEHTVGGQADAPTGHVEQEQASTSGGTQKEKRSSDGKQKEKRSSTATGTDKVRRSGVSATTAPDLQQLLRQQKSSSTATKSSTTRKPTQFEPSTLLLGQGSNVQRRPQVSTPSSPTEFAGIRPHKKSTVDSPTSESNFAPRQDGSQVLESTRLSAVSTSTTDRTRVSLPVLRRSSQHSRTSTQQFSTGRNLGPMASFKMPNRPTTSGTRPLNASAPAASSQTTKKLVGFERVQGWSSSIPSASLESGTPHPSGSTGTSASKSTPGNAKKIKYVLTEPQAGSSATGSNGKQSSGQNKDKSPATDKNKKHDEDPKKKGPRK